jgi:quercetin dioxygenase-like cupin family protein
MSDTDTGEHVDEVLDFPYGDGLRVNAVRVHYDPGGFTPGTHHHPGGAYVYVMEGSVTFGIDDGDLFVLNAGQSYFEPPGVVHSVSRNASDDVPATMLAIFVLAEGEQATINHND